MKLKFKNYKIKKNLLFNKLKNKKKLILKNLILKKWIFLFFNLFLLKIINLLMYNGNKIKIEKILSKFFNILYFTYKIKNPLETFQFLLYENKIPIIRPILVGFKIKFFKAEILDQFKRYSITLKLFLKNIKKKKKKVLLFNLIQEFFNLKYKKECSLLLYNFDTIKKIKKFKLLKNILTF